MKKIIIILALGFFVTIGCKNNVIQEPKILIDRTTMVAILYDLSVLEAMRSINSSSTISYPTATAYIKNNYKFDSITFAQNSKYYASDAKEYKKMFDEVKERLSEEAIQLNGGKKQADAVDVKN